ncbi:MAG: hemerythrin domain-containing protein [Myxococcota bacterium]
MKDPIEALMEEHRVIEQVLSAIDATAERNAPVSFYQDVVDFVVNFADGCHHDKEEGLLFPAMVGQGMPRDAGPIGVMLQEHDVGRDCVARIREAIEVGDACAAGAAAADYSALLRAHIAKEDGVLYPIARDLLPAGEIASLAVRFEEVEASRAGSARYRHLAARLLADSDEG